jgi:fumarate reductase flavoprotein subunit
MTETGMEARFDAIVVGGGIAGMTAANRLGQLGKRVALLEQGGDTAYHCNSRFSGGTVHVCYRDPVKRSPEELVAEIARHNPEAHAGLAQRVAQDTRRAIAWLRDEGVKFAKGGADEYKGWVLTPLRANRYGLMWEGRGGDVMLRTLEAALAQRGGVMHRGARAVGVEAAADAIMVRVQCGSGTRALAADAVVLADGGFQADMELMRRHVTPHAGKILQRGAATGKGDGLRIALEAGGAYVGGNRFYGHVLARDAFTNANLWPFPVLDPIVHSALVVDAAARRFADEGEGGVWVANCIAQLDDPLSAFLIFDEAIWRGPAAAGVMAPNPNMINAGGALQSADSLAGLAARVGLPAAALAQTVAAYNAAVQSGTTAGLTPGRSTKSGAALPIAQGPFHAIPLCAGITYTMGGIAIDDHARVVDASGRPVPRLYAAGCATGGLEGGPLGGYIGGLSKSGVTALRAAEHIAGAAA